MAGRCEQCEAGLILLAQAAAESKQTELFDTVTGQCVQVLKATTGHEVLFNTFTVREARLRGLLATGHIGQAIDLAESFAADDRPPTPQWRVIERITTADVLARAGDEHTAAGMLSAVLSDAETLRLPHQVQRIIRRFLASFKVAGRSILGPVCGLGEPIHPKRRNGPC